jgi:hypothetical protein
MSESLQGFISHARSKGLDHATIRQLLLTAGWKEKDIARAIAAEGLDLAVPEPAHSGNARDSFLYLMSFASLYAVAGSVIGLYYNFLDYLYPDPASGERNIDAIRNDVRAVIAWIVIAFPLFLMVSLVLQRIVRQTPDTRKQVVARWLTYLTMFLAVAVMAGDLIALLYCFLDGSLTTRFVLKVIVLLVIAQVILSYYYLARRDVAKGQSVALRRFLEATGILVVAGAVVLGFGLAGSPFTARQYRMDEKRVADLRAIHNAIQQMTTKRVNNEILMTRPLPKTLEEVAEYQRTRQAVAALNHSDPETGDKYAYTVTGEKTYEISARFALIRDRKSDLFRNHPAGQHCFKFNAQSPP